MGRGSATVSDPGLNEAFHEGVSEAHRSTEPLFRLTVYKATKIHMSFDPQSRVDVERAIVKFLDSADITTVVSFEVTPVVEEQPAVEASSIPNDDEVAEAEIIG